MEMRGPIVVVGIHTSGGLYVFSFDSEFDLDAWYQDPLSKLPRLPHVVIRSPQASKLTTQEIP